MTLVTLHDHDRRVLLFGASIMVGLVLALRGLPAWRAWRRGARIEAVEVMAQAARTEGLLGGFPQALDTLQVRRAQLLAMGAVFLTDETTSGAASNLAAFLGELARQNLVRLDAVEMHVDSSKAHALPRITVDLQATADITGLGAFLHGIELGPTLLAVRKLVLQAPNADAPRDQAEMLPIRITLEGLALVGHPGKSQ
jgi:hypothetical protein